jgi:hypothetical protein
MASAPDRALEQVAARQRQRRDFNERLAALETPDFEATPYRCECGLIACGAAIKLTRDEYVEVRSDPRRFAVFAEHVMADADRVLARRRGWAVIEQSERFVTRGPTQPSTVARLR